jgi:hypothetical protein
LIQKNTTLIWIVSGDIGIKDNVTRADGIYLTDGAFSTAYNKESDSQLVINGLIVANNGFELNRSLKNNDNLSSPSERFIYNPGFFTNINLLSLLKASPTITWKEYISY